MLSPETSTLLTLCCYGAATVAGLAGMLLRNAFWRRLGCWLAGLGFVCQTFSLLLGFHKTMPTGLSLGGYLQMLAWFVLLCGLVSRLRYKQEALLLLATPLALILFAVSAPYLSAVVQVPPQLKGSFYALHVGALFLSMGLMTLAFAASSLFLFLERRIKSKQRMEGFWQDMPALSLLDKINAFGDLYVYFYYAKDAAGNTFTVDVHADKNGEKISEIDVYVSADRNDADKQLAIWKEYARDYADKGLGAFKEAYTTDSWGDRKETFADLAAAVAHVESNGRPGPFDGGIIVVFEADGVATNLVMNQQYIYLLIKDPNYNVE